MAHIELAAAAAATDDRAVSKEFFALFIGVGRSEILPYGSYYMAGFLHERPLARVREDLAPASASSARRATSLEPEDHLGTLFEVMAGRLDGTFWAAPFEQQRDFFKRHIEPWAARFFADLVMSQTAAVLPRRRPGRPRLIELENPRPSRCPSDGEGVDEKRKSQ